MSEKLLERDDGVGVTAFCGGNGAKCLQIDTLQSYIQLSLEQVDALLPVLYEWHRERIESIIKPFREALKSEDELCECGHRRAEHFGEIRYLFSAASGISLQYEPPCCACDCFRFRFDLKVHEEQEQEFRRRALQPSMHHECTKMGGTGPCACFDGCGACDSCGRRLGEKNSP